MPRKQLPKTPFDDNENVVNVSDNVVVTESDNVNDIVNEKDNGNDNINTSENAEVIDNVNEFTTVNEIDTVNENVLINENVNINVDAIINANKRKKTSLVGFHLEDDIKKALDKATAKSGKSGRQGIRSKIANVALRKFLSDSGYL